MKIWTADEVLRQIKLGEDSRWEQKEVQLRGRKVAAPSRNKVADGLAAFGNAAGGTLVFSVTDDGRVRSLNRDELDAVEKFVYEICNDSIKPPLLYSAQRLALPEGRAVLLIEVEPSADVHQSPGGYLIRQGSSKRKLSPAALRRLFQRRGRSGLAGPDELPVAGTGRGTLEPALYNRFLSSRVSQPTVAELAKLGLLVEDDAGTMRATVAGVLLATERPDHHIRGAVIEAVCYLGTRQGKAVVHDAVTIVGPIDRQVRDAVQFARRNTRVSSRKAPGRVETPQFGPRAIFEAVVNALVHRDYSMENAKTRMFIFDDRLELYSPGALANTLSIEAMRTRQSTRNEAVASMLRMLQVGDILGADNRQYFAGDRQYFLEERGEGVPIIYEKTRELTGMDPRYELIDGAELRLTLPSARPPVEGLVGEVVVLSEGRPLPGASVLVHYPNKTWLRATTDSFGRAVFELHADLPMTVFCAAPRHGGHVEGAWRPKETETLHVQLKPLPGGGSVVFTEQEGHVPGLAGRLNPILDTFDRTYLYTINIAIDEGRAQPVHFKLAQPLLLTDVRGAERIVRFIDMFGKSALVEYEAPKDRA